MKTIQRKYIITAENDKKVKRLAKLAKTDRHPKGSSSEVVRRAIDAYTPTK